jgi:PAS domain S-box-containing protein
MELAPHTDSVYGARASRQARPPRNETRALLQALASHRVLTFAAIVATLSAAMLAFDLLSAAYWWHRAIPASIYLASAILALLVAAVLFQEWRRQRLVSRLSVSEVRIGLAAEAADLGLWSWDARTDEFWASKRCQELLGLPPQARYDANAIIASLHPDDRDLVEDAAQQVLATKISKETEFRVCLPEGQVRWLRGRGVSYSKDGTPIVMGTIMDLTERHEMQEEVRHQHQSLAHFARVGMIGELSAALAHELNQPLTAIMSNAQAGQRMLRKTPIDVAELSDLIGDIIQDDIRAGDVIHHLRSLLKDSETSVVRCDLNSVVRESLDLTRSDLIARHISVTLELSSVPLPVMGDAVQLQQVVLNLLLNAAESMAGQKGRSARLAISTFVSGSFAELSVSDKGPGIPADILKKLFDAFFTTKQNGMGLGLSICRAIVTRHGGKIWATNNESGGATFHVMLPLVEEAAS